jgi:hypothetical protein
MLQTADLIPGRLSLDHNAIDTEASVRENIVGNSAAENGELARRERLGIVTTADPAIRPYVHEKAK